MLVYVLKMKERGVIVKIAVLADIHGNLPAFNAVLKDIERHNVDKFILAGDYTGDCPQHNEVLKKVRELDAYVINGNREKYLLNYLKGLNKEWNEYKQMASVLWTYNNMDKENMEYISGLPEQLNISFDRMDSIRVVHGSPFNISEQLFPDKYPERLEKSLKGIEESVLICGHTHEPWSKVAYNKLIVNPGSVGVHWNKNKAAEYATLTWNGDKWVASHHEVEYDLKELENIFVESGMFEKCECWSKLTFESMEEGIDKIKYFLEYAYKLAEENGFKNVKLLPNSIWDKAEESWFERT